MPVLPHSKLKPIRRIAAEVLACTIQEMFPTIKLLGGNTNGFGFFYDFIFPQPFPPSFLDLIETNMKTLIKGNLEIYPQSMMRENAIALFDHYKQPFLADLVSEDPDNIVSIVKVGTYYGMCPEPLLKFTGEVGTHIKLLDVQEFQSVYPDAKQSINVVRITGTLFENKQDLKTFLKLFSQQRKKNHLNIGEDSGLFHFDLIEDNQECFWHHKGKSLLDSLADRWKRECQRRPIEMVQTPTMNKKDQHLKLYQFEQKKSFPFRCGEISLFFEEQPEWKFEGLLSPYSYQSDRFTILCLESQVREELISSLLFFKELAKISRLEIKWCLILAKSPRTERTFLRKAYIWATEALKDCEIPEFIEEESFSNATRIELHFIDALGREWCGPFIEIAENANPHCVVLHGSLIGSFDRLIGLLLDTQGMKGIENLFSIHTETKPTIS